jgi:hypothetical protein
METITQPNGKRQNHMKNNTSDKTGPLLFDSRRQALPVAGPWSTPAWTMEERLRRIEAMGRRIQGVVDFMCQIASLDGTCTAAKERAVASFYDRLVVVERQLVKIQEDIQLG